MWWIVKLAFYSKFGRNYVDFTVDFSDKEFKIV